MSVCSTACCVEHTIGITCRDFDVKYLKALSLLGCLVSHCFFPLLHQNMITQRPYLSAAAIFSVLMLLGFYCVVYCQRAPQKPTRLSRNAAGKLRRAKDRKGPLRQRKVHNGMAEGSKDQDKKGGKGDEKEENKHKGGKEEKEEEGGKEEEDGSETNDEVESEETESDSKHEIHKKNN